MGTSKVPRITRALLPCQAETQIGGQARVTGGRPQLRLNCQRTRLVPQGERKSLGRRPRPRPVNPRSLFGKEPFRFWPDAGLLSLGCKGAFKNAAFTFFPCTDEDPALFREQQIRPPPLQAFRQLQGYLGCLRSRCTLAIALVPSGSFLPKSQSAVRLNAPNYATVY